MEFWLVLTASLSEKSGLGSDNPGGQLIKSVMRVFVIYAGNLAEKAAIFFLA
jgi:hypothetical protein